MGAKVQIQSNQFLPLGKVRMGYPWGRNKLLLQITISPHLSSPEGEGQIHLTAWLSMAYQIRSNLHPPVFDKTGVTCISPTGENERGLKFIGKVTCSFPLGRLGWVLSYRGGTDSIEC